MLPKLPTIPIICAFLIDVAGQDECTGRLQDASVPAGDTSHRQTEPFDYNSSRDSTTLSIVSIDLSHLSTLQAPIYRVVHRQQWLGVNHLAIFGQLRNLAETWKPHHIVIDATGVGEGLWAMLDKAFPARVIPVKFTRQEKSEIGWRFLAIIETGRFRDCSGERATSEFRPCPPHEGWTPAAERAGQPQAATAPAADIGQRHHPGENQSNHVHLQYLSCLSEVLPGPGKILRWGVPDGTRSPDGDLIHDDYVLADSLVAKLDTLKWVLPMRTTIIRPSTSLLDSAPLLPTGSSHSDPFNF